MVVIGCGMTGRGVRMRFEVGWTGHWIGALGGKVEKVIVGEGKIGDGLDGDVGTAAVHFVLAAFLKFKGGKPFVHEVVALAIIGDLFEEEVLLFGILNAFMSLGVASDGALVTGFGEAIKGGVVGAASCFVICNGVFGVGVSRLDQI